MHFSRSFIPQQAKGIVQAGQAPLIATGKDSKPYSTQGFEVFRMV
jgi:hypothetical protein